MAAKEPENRTYPGYFGQVELALGRLRLRQGRAEDARKHLDNAVARLEESCRHRPDHVRERASLYVARKARAEANAARSDEQGRSAGP